MGFWNRSNPAAEVNRNAQLEADKEEVFQSNIRLKKRVLSLERQVRSMNTTLQLERDEAADLKGAIWAAADSQPDKTLKLDDMSAAMVDGRNCRLTTWRDPGTLRMLIRADRAEGSVAKPHRLSGNRADLIIIDDPMKPEEV